MPVATDSTQEYRELRELLDTGSSGAGAATAEAAEKKQALMVFGGAAAVVLLVIIGLVAFPKDDDTGSASATAADRTEAPAGDAAGNDATATTATPPTTAPVPALEAPAGTKAVPYEVLSTKVLPGLKAGDRVDFLNGPDVVARNILVLAVGEEQDILAGFKQRVVTIAATDEETRNLLSVTAGKRSMTQASGEPAPTTPPPSG